MHAVLHVILKHTFLIQRASKVERKNATELIWLPYTLYRAYETLRDDLLQIEEEIHGINNINAVRTVFNATTTNGLTLVARVNQFNLDHLLNEVFDAELGQLNQGHAHLAQALRYVQSVHLERTHYSSGQYAF